MPCTGSHRHAGWDSAGAGRQLRRPRSPPRPDARARVGPCGHRCTHAEHILTTADEAVFAARLDSRLGNVRCCIGHAISAYIGMPLLPRGILTGRLRYNRWDSLIRRFAWRPLMHLHALDAYLATLDSAAPPPPVHAVRRPVHRSTRGEAHVGRARPARPPRMSRGPAGRPEHPLRAGTHASGPRALQRSAGPVPCAREEPGEAPRHLPCAACDSRAVAAVVDGDTGRHSWDPGCRGW